MYIDENTDIITIEELNKVREHAKNRKIPVLVNLTMQLLECGGNELKLHMLELFNNVVDKSNT